MRWGIVALGLLIFQPTSSYAAETKSDLKKVTSYVEDLLSRCWSLPGMDGDEFPSTRLKISLNQDGSLAGPPKVLNPANDLQGKMFDDSVVRAVTRCSPFKGLAAYADIYPKWREMTVNFDVVVIPGSQQK